MQFRTIGLLLLGAMALPAAGTAQTAPTPPAITRTLIAATKLPTVRDVPVHFRAVSITLKPDERSSVSTANGILYQLSGSTEISLGGENKVLGANSSDIAATQSDTGINLDRHLGNILNLHPGTGGNGGGGTSAATRDSSDSGRPIQKSRPSGPAISSAKNAPSVRPVTRRTTSPRIQP